MNQEQKTKSAAATINASPAAADLVARARALVPALLARAPADERNHRLSERTVEEIKQAGLIRVMKPARWGGYELSPNVLADIVMTLSEGDMCVGWVYSLFANHSYHLALFDDRAQEEVWSAQEDPLISSSYAPAGRATPVDGGYRLSGRWKFSSGSDHADWILLGGLATNDPNEPRCFLVPRAECQIIDTWRVTGLKSTGSNDVAVEDVYVPKHRVYCWIDGFRGTSPGTNAGAIYKMPPLQVFYRVVTMPNIGALQAMTNEFVATGKNRSTSSGAIAKNGDALLAVGQATAAIEEMKVVQHHTFARLFDLATRGERPTIADRLRYRYQSSFVAETCRVNAAALFEAAGGLSLMEETTTMGRIYRNLIAGRQHLGAQFRVFARAAGSDCFGEEGSDVMI